MQTHYSLDTIFGHVRFFKHVNLKQSLDNFNFPKVLRQPILDHEWIHFECFTETGMSRLDSERDKCPAEKTIIYGLQD